MKVRVHADKNEHQTTVMHWQARTSDECLIAPAKRTTKQIELQHTEAGCGDYRLRHEHRFSRQSLLQQTYCPGLGGL